MKCVDFQILKLQEAPDSVPHGEMPRHLQLFADRFLVDRVVPGNRVTVLGIYSIKKANMDKAKKSDKGSAGVRAPYLRVCHVFDLLIIVKDILYLWFFKKHDVFQTFHKVKSISLHITLLYFY